MLTVDPTGLSVPGGSLWEAGLTYVDIQLWLQRHVAQAAISRPSATGCLTLDKVLKLVEP